MRRQVMGGLPVLNSSITLGLVGILTLVGYPTSGSMQDFGATSVDMAWGAALLVGAALVIVSLFVRDWVLTPLLESAGMFCMVVGIVVFGYVIYDVAGFPGAVMVLALSYNAASAMAGRIGFLWRDARRQSRGEA